MEGIHRFRYRRQSILVVSTLLLALAANAAVASTPSDSGSAQVPLATVASPLSEVLLDAELDPETEAAVAELQAYAGITRQQALETIGYQEQYGLLSTELERRYPDNFGGAWIDHASGGILVIAMTDTSVVTEPIPAEINGRVRLITVDRSLEELRTMSADLSKHIDETAGWASPDLKRNGIQIELIESAAVAQMRRSGLTSGVTALEDKGVPVTQRELDALPIEASCSSTANCSPLPAGAAINGPDSCSSGFKVRRPSTGWDGMLTAKHCDPGVYTHYIYNVLTSSGGTSDCCSDVRFLRKYSSGSLSLADDVYSFGTLKDMAAWANPVLDQTVCRGGRNSSDCGVVVNTKISGYRFRINNLVACPGDSGGPVYSGSTGIGIFTHLTNNDCPGPGTQTSYAVKVGRALGSMSLTFSTS